MLVAYRAFSDVAGKGAQLLITLVAARRLSGASFGLFALGSTVGWIGAVASDFGIQLHLARSLALDSRRARELLRSWLRVRVWTSSLAAVSLAVWVSINRPHLDVGVVILLFALVYLLNGLVEFLFYFFRGLSRTDIESTLTLWQRVSTLIVALVVLWESPTVARLGLGMLVAAAATLHLSLRRARRLAAESALEQDPHPSHPGGSLAQEFAIEVVPVGAGIVLSALYFRIDVFLVELWHGSVAVGLYNAVFRLVEALRLFPAAVLAVALPALCRASGRDPLVRVASVVTLSGVAATGVLWFLADGLVPWLYGPRFVEAVPAFRILLLAFPLMSLNYALTHQLVGWRHHGLYCIVSAAALAFNLALNVRVIPEKGFVGAAWTTVWTEAVVTLGCLTALWYVLTRARALGAEVVAALPDREPPDAVEHLLVM